MFGYEMHHIVFRSQGGLDFPLNLVRLTPMEHRGPYSPHLNKRIDLIYKRDLQKRLYELFNEEEYLIEDIAKKLGRPKALKYFSKHFRRAPSAAGLYKSEDIIKRLMGGRFY